MITRKQPRSADNHSPDVTLAPKGRRARFGKAAIVATVGLGYAERPNMFGGGIYRHPEVIFRTIDESGETSICGLKVTLTYQTHVVGSGESRFDKPGPEGFLACEKGPWVPCYGGKLEADYQYSGDAREITRAMGLIERAREATHDLRIECALLRLIVGLRRVGVEVRIYSKHVDQQRARRQSAMTVGDDTAIAVECTLHTLAATFAHT